MVIEWEWSEGAWTARTAGFVRAVVRERVSKDYWNLHLHDLPWEVRTFPYRSPETAMKHATRWLERRRMPTVEERRRRTDEFFKGSLAKTKPAEAVVNCPTCGQHLGLATKAR